MDATNLILHFDGGCTQNPGGVMTDEVTHFPLAVNGQVIPGYRIAVTKNGTTIQSQINNRWGTSDKWKDLKSSINTTGYTRVNIKIGGIKRNCNIHRLVAEAVYGPCPSGMQVRHLNGIRHDNRPENLAYGTPSDNEKDKIAHGTSHHGSRHPLAKLDENAVAEIKERYRKGERQRKLAAEFGVSQSAISLIVNAKRWDGD